MAFVDCDYRGVQFTGAHVWKSGQRRGATRNLKARIRRRSAIEPTIGHMKSDGKLERNWLRGYHAMPCPPCFAVLATASDSFSTN